MSKNQFQVLVADNPESRKLHYVIRYRVFCVETGYEDASKYPDKMERDVYDDRSVHFLLRVRETGQWVAAVRLALGSIDTLPLVEKCVFDRDMDISPHMQVAEVSRLCVVGSLRRRKQEQATPYVIPWERKYGDITVPPGLERLERRREPEILVRLIHAVIEYGRNNNMRYYYALMADPLVRILQRIGLRITPIGPVCMHRGIRRPYLIDLQTVLTDVSSRSSPTNRIFEQKPAYQSYTDWKELVGARLSGERNMAYGRV